MPGRHRPSQRPGRSGRDVADRSPAQYLSDRSASCGKSPVRGAAVVGGADDADVARQLERLAHRRGRPAPRRPRRTPPWRRGRPGRHRLRRRRRLGGQGGKAVEALPADIRPCGGCCARRASSSAAARRQGRVPLHRAGLAVREHAGRPARREPIVGATFDEADRIMTPLLGRPLSDYIFADNPDDPAVQRLEQQLMQTEITQPAVLTADLALTRLLAAYGVAPDMVMGHSLGEYGALVAAGALSFAAALEAVSARGHEMATLPGPTTARWLRSSARWPRSSGSWHRPTAMSSSRTSTAPARPSSAGPPLRSSAPSRQFQAAGMTAVRIPVSHAFHTAIVAPASEPLQDVLRRLDLRAPVLPIVANVTGEFYPADADVDAMVDLLGRQVASPVQFVKGLRTLYDAGARVFVEVGPKKALHGFVEDVLAAKTTCSRCSPTTRRLADVDGVQPGAVRAVRRRPRLRAPAVAPSAVPTTINRAEERHGRNVRRWGTSSPNCPRPWSRASTSPPATPPHQSQGATVVQRAGGHHRCRAGPAWRRPGLR